MNKLTTIALLALSSVQAHAVYKCVGPQGTVSFQDAPCPNSQKQATVRVGSTAPPDAVAPAKPGADQRMLAALTHDRRVRELQESIAEIETVIDRRNGRMNDEIEALRNRKSYAKNNLAGATWEQSLSTEMQAVTAKYKTMNDTDFERLKQLRATLSKEQETVSGR